jgi:5-methylcytosine-specific restriction endonuclease McrA
VLTLVPTLKKTCRGKCGLELPLDAFGVQARGLYGRKSECKPCLAAKEAARRAADPEAARAYKREWWAKQEWTPEERAEASAKFKAWYADPENKIRHAASMRRWVRENQAAFKEIQQRYLAKNPVHIRRRAYLVKVERTLTQEQWNEILEVFDHRCAYCLRSDVKLTMDHVIPVSKGGPHTAENVVPACKPCNSQKWDRPIFLMVGKAA